MLPVNTQSPYSALPDQNGVVHTIDGYTSTIIYASDKVRAAENPAQMPGIVEKMS